MDISYADDATKLLEYLDNCRGLISTVDHAEIPIDHQIHTLKLDLRFLRTYLKERKGKNDLCSHSYGKEIRDFVQNAVSELHSLCLESTTHKSTTTKFELFVSNMINDMKGYYKERIRKSYTWKYLETLFDAPMTKEILKDLADSLLENLKDIQICETDLIVSVKTQIEALEEKVIFVRNFLSWLVDQRDSKESIQKEKLAGLLTRIESVILGAVYWSYCCFVGEVQETEYVKCNICYVVWMIKRIELEVPEICLEFLKDSKSSQPDFLPVNLLTLVSIDSLLNILMQLLESESIFMVPLKDEIGTLNQELRFLRALLMNPPPRKHNKHEEVDGLLANIDAFISDAESSIYSFYVDEMKEETTDEMHLLLSAFLDKIKLIKSEVRNNYFKVQQKPKFKSLGTDELRFIDLLLENLDELLKDSVSELQHQVQIIQGELRSLRVLLILEDGNKHERSEIIKHVIEVAQEVEYAMKSYVVGDGPLWYHILKLSDLSEALKLIKTECGDIFNTKRCNNTVHNIQKTTPIVSQQAYTVTTEEAMVGFEDQAHKIINRLMGGSIQLDLVSIVGMPGLGKTTLARKLYNDPKISFYFHICAWCCVSQAYQKRVLLLDILSHVIEVTDRVRKMSDEDLAEQLYKGLKGRKYLIVMDDMWNIDAWNDFKKYFPNDQNGSRIMITSRINEVALQAKPNSSPHFLRMFSEEESWKLLQEKLFKTESCPMELVEIGEHIARNCKGLPLAVVLIAGILARMDKKVCEWKQVATSLSTLIVNDSKQCRDILELSYKNLPDHLRPCFLYFGAFAEDKEIPVQKLSRLWIAEGFVQKSEVKGLEDVAEDYLMDLIGRSLVIVDKTRSKGGVKTCRVHDLLHDFCLEKAKEEKFLQLINGRNELFAPYSGGSDDNASYHLFYSTVPQQHRLCIHSEHEDFVAWKPFDRHVHSLLVFATDRWKWLLQIYPRDYSFIFYSLKLLKVLDLGSITMEAFFPGEIVLLVYLRYLAVRGVMNYIPSTIVNLTKLETLFVKGVKGEVKLPDTLWEMVNLRHVLIEKRASLRLLIGRKSIQMHNLRTFGTPYLSHNEVDIIRGCPNLRKFKCIFPESWDSVSNCNQFPALDFLTQLESLNVFFHGTVRHHCKFMFPLNLKKLTLAKFRLPWNEITQIGRLPNLEVLKLLFKSFEGKSWDMKDGEFLNLKYLKLDNLDITEWNASSDHFPCLERLVLQRCKQLGELPSSLEEVLSLQVIEMEMCSPSAAKSAMQIQEHQKDIGNEEFKILIKNCKLTSTASHGKLKYGQSS